MLAQYYYRIMLTFVAITSFSVISQTENVQHDEPNIVFIAVDDLNDWVGYLGGHPDTKTPNIDKLAKRGVYFTNAYTVSPICGPSRASVLTGQRPETTGVYHNVGAYKDYVPNVTALPQFLRKNGYHVMGAGKINHSMSMLYPENFDEYGPSAGAIGGPFTLEELNLTPKKQFKRLDIHGAESNQKSGIVKNVYPGKIIKRGTLSATLPLNGINNVLDRPFNGYNTFDWGPVDVTDDEMPDGKVAKWAEQKLSQSYEKPFFLGVGFYRPHQPFYAPRKYFDAFTDVDISLPKVIDNDLDDLSIPASYYAHYPWSGSFDRVQKQHKWQDGVKGYLAAIHFADAQIGRVLDALDNSAHKDNTLIVLWSDHGWELGEKEHWGKHTAWEGSTRVPFVIVPPKNMNIKNSSNNSFVSLLDIYPTIADYANVAIPTYLEGKSLKSLVDGKQDKVRDYSITTLGRASYAIRKGNWKYIHYFDGSEELYNLSIDSHEWHNLASKTEQQNRLYELRTLVPIDAHFQQLIRYKNWKAIITSSNEFQLYDLLEPKNGIGEHDEVSKENPDIVKTIKRGLASLKADQRYISLVSEN